MTLADVPAIVDTMSYPPNPSYVEVNGNKYPRLTVQWRDIIGDSAVTEAKEFEELVCPVVTTQGYLFDTFFEDGEMYVRPFATFQGDADAFGDRNCFPFSVLTEECQKEVKRLLGFS